MQHLSYPMLRITEGKATIIHVKKQPKVASPKTYELFKGSATTSTGYIETKTHQLERSNKNACSRVNEAYRQTNSRCVRGRYEREMMK